LLPLGEPSETAAEKAFEIAKRVFKAIESAIKWKILGNLKMTNIVTP